MRLLVVGLLFVVAGLCEIGGGYLDRCCVIGDEKGAEILCWHRTSTKRQCPMMDLDSFLVSLYVLVEVSLDSTVVRAHQHAAGARRLPSRANAKRGHHILQTRRSDVVGGA